MSAALIQADLSSAVSTLYHFCVVTPELLTTESCIDTLWPWAKLKATSRADGAWGAVLNVLLGTITMAWVWFLV